MNNETLESIAEKITATKTGAAGDAFNFLTGYLGASVKLGDFSEDAAGKILAALESAVNFTEREKARKAEQMEGGK